MNFQVLRDNLELVGVIVQIVLAITTFTLAIAAFNQVKVSKVAASATADAAKITATAVEEATRARLDELAPRVTMLPLYPEWPPSLHMTLQRAPAGGEPSLFASTNLHSSPQLGLNEILVFPRDENKFLWFKTWGLLINEGKTTAIVRLDGDAEFTEESGPFWEGVADLPLPVGTPQDRYFALEPGDKAVFTWGAGRVLHEWADAYEKPAPPNPLGALFFCVTVFDGFGAGVIDHIYAEVAARPIEPVPNEDGHWRLARSAQVYAVRYATQRSYSNLDKGLPPAPPWTETYKLKWSKN